MRHRNPNANWIDESCITKAKQSTPKKGKNRRKQGKKVWIAMRYHSFCMAVKAGQSPIYEEKTDKETVEMTLQKDAENL